MLHHHVLFRGRDYAEEEGWWRQGRKAQDARGGASQERTTFVRWVIGRGDVGQGTEGDLYVLDGGSGSFQGCDCEEVLLRMRVPVVL